MTNIEERRIQKIKAEAGLVEISFPACCISCAFEEHDYCKELNIAIDNPFQICNFYKD